MRDMSFMSFECCIRNVLGLHFTLVATSQEGHTIILNLILSVKRREEKRQDRILKTYTVIEVLYMY